VRAQRGTIVHVALVWVLLGIAVLAGVAVVAAGRGEGLTPSAPDRPDVALPEDRPLVRNDVDQVRFSVGLRGYRMDEVDDVLDRLALDLEARDSRIAALEQVVASFGRTPVPVGVPAEAAPAPETAQAGDDDMQVARTIIVPFQPSETGDRHERSESSADAPADSDAGDAPADDAHDAAGDEDDGPGGADAGRGPAGA
jgi:DivIVA domain-containing protein